MNEKELIALLEKALRQNTALYNGLGSGEISKKKAGHLYDTQVGYDTIQALKGALEEIKPQLNFFKEEV